MQELLKTENRKLAEKVYAKTLTDIIEGRYFEATEARTRIFGEMSKKYLEKHAHSRDYYTSKPLSEFFGQLTLAQS